jgi:hypothetical protein
MDRVKPWMIPTDTPVLLEDGLALTTDEIVAREKALRKEIKLYRGALLDVVIFGGAALDPDDEDDRALALSVLRATINRARIILGLPTEAHHAHPE